MRFCSDLADIDYVCVGCLEIEELRKKMDGVVLAAKGADGEYYY